MNSNTILIQNMITPYRNRLFNTLNEKGLDFSVFYMSKTESDRNWNIDDKDINHKRWLDRCGVYFYIKAMHVHINPLLVLKVLLNRKAKNVILGASYVDLNIIALVFAKKLHLTSKKFFFWAEANYLTNGARSESKWKSKFRKFVFSCVDGALIVPGKMSEITFEKWEINAKEFIHLPNTISDNQLSYKKGNRNVKEKPIFLMPIRLIESIKGAINFFNSIGEDNIRKCIFFIAGDGEDKKLYEDYITKNHFENNITLLGFQDALEMEQVYNEANAFVLPSFSDPSPLSMVEALKTHLPILCSTHCGNHYEVVIEGENGYCFNPLDKNDIKDKFEAFLSKRDQWTQMGEISYKNYLNIFETNKVADNFIEHFNSIAN